ncbi:MAG: hypothetical protein ACK4NY_16460 [Spirosomataceae bacterium]
MNYLEIVLNGFFDNNSRNFLDKYFYREYQKAKKEHFEVDEFFTGCLDVIEQFEQYLTDRVSKRFYDLCLMLTSAKDGTLQYKDLEGKSYEQKSYETIEYCEHELKERRPDGIGSISFTVHLSSLTNGKYIYNMTYGEVLRIKIAIKESKTLCLQEENYISDKEASQTLLQQNKVAISKIEKRKKQPTEAPAYIQELFKLYNEFKNKGTDKREIIGKIAIKVLSEDHREIKQHFKTDNLKSLKTEIRRYLQKYGFLQKESDKKR